LPTKFLNSNLYMALDQILSVSGKSGLFKLVGQMKNGIIVEGIADKKRFPVHGATKVSALEEISIYTNDAEMPLNDVFKKIYEKENGKQTKDSKADKAEIKAYFESVLPEYDQERVYVSDMIKVIKWYNTLIEFDSYDPTEEGENEGEKEADKKGDEKPAAKKKTTKKAAPKKVAKPAPQNKVSSGASSPRKAGGAQRGS